MTQVAVVYHSGFGHTAVQAKAVAAGAESVPGTKVKLVSVDGLPAELPYVEKGLAPVLLAQPTYLWGYVSVKTIVDHVYLKKEVPAHVQMELVRVSTENLGTWARQLRDWGFTTVDPKYLALPK